MYAKHNECLQKILVNQSITISEAISVLDKGGLGVILLCKDENSLVGSITDGDVRRAILHNISFDRPAIDIACKNPITAPLGISSTEALYLMDHGKDFIINHLPIVDSEGQVIDLILRRDLIKDNYFPPLAVIMAGGLGTRLRPLTENLPKPMLPVGDRPLMEHIVKKLQESGIHKVNITTHYKPEKITSYFGNGHAFGVEINYVPEDRPLGTAGALGLMPDTEDTLLVMNGDILTQVNFRAMLDYHHENHADMTMAVRQYIMQIPYGIVECDGERVSRINEKPRLNFLANAGIYLIEPIVRKYIKKGQMMDMTDLIQSLINKGNKVVSFPIIEYWLDIGQHADYERAQQDVQNGRCAL